MKIYETKFYKKRFIFLGKDYYRFYRKVRTEKQTLWEFFSSYEEKWVKINNSRETIDIDPSSALEFLLFTGKSPDSFTRRKMKKVEK